MLLFSETLPGSVACGKRSDGADGRFVPYFSRLAWHDARQPIRRVEAGPKARLFREASGITRQAI